MEPNFRQSGIRFESTITAGNLLTIGAGIIAMAGAYVDYRLTEDRHEARISISEQGISALRQQIADQAHAQQEMTRAIDRLTFQLQNAPK